MIVSVCVLSLPGPGPIPVRLTVWMEASSSSVQFVKAFIVGGSLTGLTVSKKELVVDNVPSLTTRVIVLLPNVLVRGDKLTVRSLPVPPKTILVFGTRVELDEVPERINASAAVSKSLIEKEMMAVVSSLVANPGMLEIKGGLLTVNTLLKALVKPGALAVSCLIVPPTSICRFV